MPGPWAYPVQGRGGVGLAWLWPGLGQCPFAQGAAEARTLAGGRLGMTPGWDAALILGVPNHS